MAVGTGGRLYVLGGYTADGVASRTFFVLERGSWRALPRMPYPRAAAGAGIAARRIVVAGGIGAGRRLARNTLSFDLRTNRWSSSSALRFESTWAWRHSAASSTRSVDGRRVWIRTSCISSRIDRATRRGAGCSPYPILEAEQARQASRASSSRPEERSRVAPSPRSSPTGSPSDAGCGSRIFTTPRHGVGVAALGGRVFVIGGGPEPGLTVSDANEALAGPGLRWLMPRSRASGCAIWRVGDASARAAPGIWLQPDPGSRAGRALRDGRAAPRRPALRPLSRRAPERPAHAPETAISRHQPSSRSTSS